MSDTVRSPLLQLLLLGLAGLGCSEGVDDAGLAGEPQLLAAAPRAESLLDLDPAAQELIKRNAAQLEDAIDEARLWTELGAAYHANRRFTLARTCYEQRLLRDPGDARTWYYLALIEDELGDSDAAIGHLARAMRLEPGHAPAHWRSGFLLLAQGRIEAAEAAMQAALELAPEDPAAVVGMARVRIQQGAHAAAVALLEAHMERLPDDDNARFLLGTSYRRLGNAEKAARALTAGSGGAPVRRDAWEDELLSRRRGYRTDFLEAVELLDGGSVERATGLLEALRERKPDDTLVLLSLHRAYRMKGEQERALELLLEARRVEPTHGMVHLHLAGAYRDKARAGGQSPDPTLLEVALISAEQACALSPTFAAAHGLRGDVLHDLARADEALEAFVEAAGLDRDSAMWHQKAGESLCKAGRWQEALPFLRRLEVLTPESARALFFLSAALANSGHLEEAVAPARRAALLAPDDPVIQKGLESVLRGKATGSDE